MGMSGFRFLTVALVAASITLGYGINFGVQSGDGEIASSFASSMVYDAQKKRLFVTGSTFGGFFDPGGKKYKENSDCFLAVIQLPTRPGDSDPVWLRRMTIGDEAVTEACSSIYAEAEDIQSVHLVGHSDPIEEGIAVSGVILDVSWLNGLQAGYQIRSNQVQYPLFIHAHPSNKDLFVASMVSDSSDARLAPINELGVFQDYVAGGYSMQNLDFSILVQRIQKNQGTKSATHISGLQDISTSQVWAQKIISDSSLHLSGMTSLDSERVLIASLESDPGDSNKYHVFLTVLSIATGEKMNSKRMKDLVQGGSTPGLGLCKPDPPNDKSLYIAGSTISPGAATTSISMESSRAFLMKISTETLEMEWISYLGVVSNEDIAGVNGQACSVTMDGSLVYFAGNVQAGSVVSLDGINPLISKSLGGIDIFAAQIQTNDGTLIFAHQIGSDQDDLLATGGDSLTCDQEGNLIVLGNTRGSMFRRKEPIGEGLANDVVVFTVDRVTGSIGKIPGEVVPDRPNTHINSPNDEDLIFYPNESDPLFGDSTLESVPTVQPAPMSSRAGYVIGFLLVTNLALFSSVLLFFLRREKRRDQYLYRKFLGALMFQQEVYNDENPSIVSTSSSRDSEDHAAGSAYLVDDQCGFQQKAFNLPEHDPFRSSLESESGYDKDTFPSYKKDALYNHEPHKYCSENENECCIQKELEYYEEIKEIGSPHELTTRPHLD